jgi:hypothetical protein
VEKTKRNLTWIMLLSFLLLASQTGMADAATPQTNQTVPFSWMVGFAPSARNLSIGQECTPFEVLMGCYEFWDENNPSTQTFAPSVIVWRI